MNQKRLTGLRAYRKLTVEKLADLSQIPPLLIHAFESGEDWPDSEQCIALANALRVDVSRLLDPGDLTFRDFVRRGGGELSSQQVSAIGVAMVDRIRDHLDVREVLGLPPISWTSPAGAPVQVRNPSVAEAAADRVRAAWRRGDSAFPEDLVERGRQILATASTAARGICDDPKVRLLIQDSGPRTSEALTIVPLLLNLLPSGALGDASVALVAILIARMGLGAFCASRERTRF